MDTPPDLVSLLAKAIRDAVWFKRKVTALLTNCGVSPALQQKAAANAAGATTVQLIPEVISELNALGGSGDFAIRKLFTTMCGWKDFTSLEPDKQVVARASVAELKRAVDAHQSEVEFAERKAREEWAIRSQQDRESRQSVKPLDLAKLQSFHDRFDSIYVMTDEQERGNRFQDLMNDVFKEHTTLSTGAFTRTGEQIDGLFYFDNHPYFVEVRWKRKKTNAADISVLRDRATSGFGGDTKALFIAFEGFSPDALDRLQGKSGERVVLMDGLDIHVVLEGQISLEVLLMEKQMDLARGTRAIVSAYEVLDARKKRI